MKKSILMEKYDKEVLPKLKEKFGYKNVMAIPRISKISINIGVGKFLKEKEAVDEIVENLRTISGQKPVQTKAKKSIAGFKIRQGQEVGVAVTLRGIRMWQFMERLVFSALPRVRDFRGIDEKCFDNQGNICVVVKEHTVFPEIVPENVKNIFSLQINIVNSGKTKEEGTELYRLLGFPLALSEK
ncbi:MAG: 50S ribosomal protein L5 [Parcubacteria group bacterium]|jgi:large subunit ribosomal protein L5